MAKSVVNRRGSSSQQDPSVRGTLGVSKPTRNDGRRPRWNVNNSMSASICIAAGR